MISQRHGLLAVLLIGASSLPSMGCAYSGGPIEGKVLEEGTDRPIADAIVVVRWQGTAFSFVESPTVCIHVETATTDKNGRYRIPFWRASAKPSGVHRIEPIVTAYKAEYQWPKRLPKDLGSGDQYLRPSTGTRDERLRYLRRLSSATSCGAQNGSEKNSLPLLKAIYEEAKSSGGDVRQASNEMSLVESLRYRIEILELGFEEAEKRHLERP